jgi:glutamine amidotransferase
MQGLQSVDGAAIIRERIANERPVLGICIGMQILFQEGSEHGENANHAGIGVWEGEVSRLDAPILPHMGWNNVESDPNSTLFKGLAGESFYFVHSFAAKKAVGKMQGWSFHGEKFLAAVEDGYVSATQFHPEKSGDAGLALIANWVKSL